MNHDLISFVTLFLDSTTPGEPQNEGIRLAVRDMAAIYRAEDALHRARARLYDLGRETPTYGE